MARTPEEMRSLSPQESEEEDNGIENKEGAEGEALENNPYDELNHAIDEPRCVELREEALKKISNFLDGQKLDINGTPGITPPLVTAIRFGSVDAFALLLNREPKPNLQIKSIEAPNSLYNQTSQEKSLSLMEVAIANVGEYNDNYPKESDELKKVKLLQQHGLNLMDHPNKYALLNFAIRNNLQDLMHDLLDNHGLNINGQEEIEDQERLNPPLSEAVIYASAATLKLLLERKPAPDINVRSAGIYNKDRSLLFLAIAARDEADCAKHDKFEKVKLLLAHKANSQERIKTNLFAGDANGQSLLAIAVKQGCKKEYGSLENEVARSEEEAKHDEEAANIVDLLLQHGLFDSINEIIINEMGPQTLLMSTDNTETIKTLLRWNADPYKVIQITNKHYNKYYHALGDAARGSKLDVVEALLSLGVDPNFAPLKRPILTDILDQVRDDREDANILRDYHLPEQFAKNEDPVRNYYESQMRDALRTLFCVMKMGMDITRMLLNQEYYDPLFGFLFRDFRWGIVLMSADRLYFELQSTIEAEFESKKTNDSAQDRLLIQKIIAKYVKEEGEKIWQVLERNIERAAGLSKDQPNFSEDFRNFSKRNQVRKMGEICLSNLLYKHFRRLIVRPPTHLNITHFDFITGQIEQIDEPYKESGYALPSAAAASSSASMSSTVSSLALVPVLAFSSAGQSIGNCSQSLSSESIVASVQVQDAKIGGQTQILSVPDSQGLESTIARACPYS